MERPLESKKLPKTSARSENQAELPFGRKARFGVFALLVFTICFAAVAVLGKFKLEAYRASAVSTLEERLGVELALGRISLNGFRGLRIDGLKIRGQIEGGPSVSLETPVVYVHVNLSDLFYGKISVDRIALDGSTIVVERPLEADWYGSSPADFEQNFGLSATDSFRLTGKDCSIRVLNVVGDTEIVIQGLAFDVSRPVEAVDLIAHIEGNLDGDSNRHFTAKLTFASFEDFYLQASTENLTADDINVFLPSESGLVTSGVIKPTVWVNGRAGGTVIVSLDAPFENLAIRDQPDFLGVNSGALFAYATYSTKDHVLSITAAKAESEDIDGVLEGTISFAGAYPAFDLRLRTTRLPADKLIDYVLDEEISEHGTSELVLNEPHELILALAGTSDAPVLTAQLSAGSGEFTFKPTDDVYPRVVAALGPMEGTWDSTSRALTASFVVVDGTVDHAETGLKAEHVSGTLLIDRGIAKMTPVNAIVTGNPFVGSFYYDAKNDHGEVTLSGMLSGIEDLSILNAVDNTSVSGSLNLLRCTAVKRGNFYSIDAEVDGTQAQLDFSWWFSKPAGVGARVSVHIDVLSGRSALIVIDDAEIATSKFSATSTLQYASDAGGAWLMDTTKAQSDYLDINALAKCITVPYRVTGGAATAAHFIWERLPQYEDGWRETFGCSLDELTLLPKVEDAVSPMTVKNATLTGTVESGATNRGVIALRAGSAVMPPLGEPWFIPMRGENDARSPSFDEREWEYTLSADVLEMPPWNGKNFTARAYRSEENNGFYAYGADVAEGRIDGDYHIRRADNAYTTEIRWSNIPAGYFIEHMGLPDVLKGNVTGEVVYELDRDDPGTLDGHGSFEVSGGKFNADFLSSLVEGQVDDQISALPPSLEFDRLRAVVDFKGDVVTTPVLELFSEGINVEAVGSYVRDGDMDYRLKLAVAPDTAEQIPLLKEYFSVLGHRTLNRDIDLVIDIVGPTFDPRGQLVQLPPASVTLVSGGIELASEAFGIINLPRRILLDLLKIGGGIFGAGTP